MLTKVALRNPSKAVYNNCDGLGKIEYSLMCLLTRAGSSCLYSVTAGTAGRPSQGPGVRVMLSLLVAAWKYREIKMTLEHMSISNSYTHKEMYANISQF